jgi:hypothetical protein
MAGALLGLARAGSLGVAVLILRTLVPWRYSAARSLLQDSSS